MSFLGHGKPMSMLPAADIPVANAKAVVTVARDRWSSPR